MRIGEPVGTFYSQKIAASTILLVYTAMVTIFLHLKIHFSQKNNKKVV